MIVSPVIKSGRNRDLPRENPAIPSWHIGPEISSGNGTSIYRARPANSPPDAPYDYAIKHLRDPTQPHRLQQFSTEVAVGNAVQHAHLVPIFAASVRSTSCYLVMPLLPGATIAQALRRSPRFATSTAIWIARQTSEALIELHAVSWLHGDLKPANMIATADGHTTLIDLGFARRIEQQSTIEGPLTGSVAYAAPELFTNDPMTAAADVYSLAITLFQMLTGQFPYDAESSEDFANAHLTQRPLDVRDCNPLVPRRIAWLLRRSLSKQPLRRPSAMEFRDVLAAIEIELMSSL